jgi:hypothetical protein
MALRPGTCKITAALSRWAALSLSSFKRDQIAHSGARSQPTLIIRGSVLHDKAGARKNPASMAERPEYAEWTFTIRFSRSEQLQKRTKEKARWVYGITDICFQSYHADIQICHPKDMALFDPSVPTERTVLHEMLHCLLDPAQTLDGDSIFEIALDRIADALIDCSRK